MVAWDEVGLCGRVQKGAKWGTSVILVTIFKNIWLIKTKEVYSVPIKKIFTKTKEFWQVLKSFYFAFKIYVTEEFILFREIIL